MIPITQVYKVYDVFATEGRSGTSCRVLWAKKQLAVAEDQRIRLGGIVKLLGWRRDVADLLRAMDLFLLTSLYEGLPRAVLQAMAVGTPVVATAVDGTPEVVEHRRTGLLVPPSSPESAAGAVLELMGDRLLRRRCVAEAKRRVGTEFDIRRMVLDLGRLYLSLLNGDARPTRAGERVVHAG